MKKLLVLCCLSWLFPLEIAQSVPFKAVNLGAWLVAERWINPAPFQDIINNDLLDGNQVQFKSTKHNKYLSAENGGGAGLVANRPSASGWETFRFIGLDNQGINVVAVSTRTGPAETFRITRNKDKVRIQASNGQFLKANTESTVTADYGGSSSDWADENPSVFKMEIIKKLGGEYQLTNGYGPDKAPQKMREHWDSYIVEEDFKFMSESGLNAVRIPVGWWIKYDQNPPRPFVGGSLQALDKAFTWAETYNMKVIVDLHAAPGSQNEKDHSGTRDGYQRWGDSHIDETVSVIDFLAERYANRTSLGAIELMNEPMAPGVTLDALSKYYKAGYAAVRKYTQSAYVILSNRLGHANNKELLSLASGLSGSVIDVHYYNLYNDKVFKNMTPQQNIDFIYKDRAAKLQEVTQSNGPLTFVGEWTAEWELKNAPIEDYAKAQLEVYGKATFGWAFWSYKNKNARWSLRQLIKNNSINLKG